VQEGWRGGLERRGEGRWVMRGGEEGEEREVKKHT
jgi:hypothetical protein